MTYLFPSPAICPLCSQTNQCAIALGQVPADCWCMHARIPPAALDAIPLGARRQRCLCPVCARSVEYADSVASANVDATL